MGGLLKMLGLVGVVLSACACGDDPAGPGDAGEADPSMVTADASAPPVEGPESGGEAAQPAVGMDGGTTNTGGGTMADAGLQPPEPDGPDLTLACIEYVRGYCEGAVRCGQSETLDQCMQVARRCPDLLFATGSTRTLEGTLQCADAWREAQCGAFFADEVPECATRGTLGAGAACVSRFQCASGVCGSIVDGCGRCLSRAVESEPCLVDDVVCDRGLQCDGVSGLCVPLPAAAPPEQPALGDPCSGSCGEYDCRWASDNVQRCMPFPTLGQDCSTTPRRCAPGDSYCDGDSLVCEAIPVAGQPCGADGPFSLATCAPEAYCDLDQEPPTCVARPLPGEPCDVERCFESACRCVDDACSSTACLAKAYPSEPCQSGRDECIASQCQGGICVPVEWQGLHEAHCDTP